MPLYIHFLVSPITDKTNYLTEEILPGQIFQLFAITAR